MLLNYFTAKWLIWEVKNRVPMGFCCAGVLWVWNYLTTPAWPTQRPCLPTGRKTWQASPALRVSRHFELFFSGADVHKRLFTWAGGNWCNGIVFHAVLREKFPQTLVLHSEVCFVVLLTAAGRFAVSTHWVCVSAFLPQVSLIKYSPLFSSQSDLFPHSG